MSAAPSKYRFLLINAFSLQPGSEFQLRSFSGAKELQLYNYEDVNPFLEGIQFAYTYSHEIDEVSGDLGGLANPFNAAYNRASGDLDRRHDFNANYIWAMPFFAHSDNVLARTTLGGWGSRRNHSHCGYQECHSRSLITAPTRF